MTQNKKRCFNIYTPHSVKILFLSLSPEEILEGGGKQVFIN
jgi:hypothetical protein